MKIKDDESLPGEFLIVNYIDDNDIWSSSIYCALADVPAIVKIAGAAWRFKPSFDRKNYKDNPYTTMVRDGLGYIAEDSDIVAALREAGFRGEVVFRGRY